MGKKDRDNANDGKGKKKYSIKQIGIGSNRSKKGGRTHASSYDSKSCKDGAVSGGPYSVVLNTDAEGCIDEIETITTLPSSNVSNSRSLVRSPSGSSTKVQSSDRSTLEEVTKLVEEKSSSHQPLSEGIEKCVISDCPTGEVPLENICLTYATSEAIDTSVSQCELSQQQFERQNAVRYTSGSCEMISSGTGGFVSCLESDSADNNIIEKDNAMGGPSVSSQNSIADKTKGSVSEEYSSISEDSSENLDDLVKDKDIDKISQNDAENCIESTELCAEYETENELEVETEPVKIDSTEPESTYESGSVDINIADTESAAITASGELKTDTESDLQLAYKYKKFGTIRKAISKQSRSRFKQSINFQDSIDIGDEPLVPTKRTSRDAKTLNIRKEYILSFLRDEMGFIDCIKGAKEFEENLKFAQKSSKTAALKSDDWKKFYLDFSTLEVAYSPNHSILLNMMNEKGNDIIIGEYFKNLSFAFPIMKKICTNCNATFKVLRKYESNDRIRETINRFITIQHWSTSLRYEDIINTITKRFKNYLDYLEKILCITDRNHFEYLELRKILDNCIIMWDVLRIVNKEKKAPCHRSLSFITDAVVIQSNKTRVHRYVALFMDAFVIAEENQRGGVISVRVASSVKRCKIVETPDKIVSLVTLPKDKIRNLKASIAHNRHLLQTLETKYKSKSSSKKHKYMKPLIEQESSLRLQTAQLPLTVELNKKNKITILFYQESDLAMWTRLICSRVNSLYIDDWPILQTDLQRSVDVITEAIFTDTEKKGSDDAFKEHNLLTTILSESIEETNTKRLSTEISGLTGVLFCKLIFENKRSDKTDLAVNFEMDNYGEFFTKCTSQTVKCGDTLTELIRMYVEDTTSLHITVVKAKSNSEVASVPTIDLINEKMHRKPYKAFKNDLEVGRLVVILEYVDDDDFTSPQYIDKINHFQNSIPSIVSSELSDVPNVLKFCVAAIEEYGLDTQGLYRVSGVKSQILNLKKDWESGFILSPDDLVGHDIHCVTGILKMFLRDLEERIVPASFAEAFQEINSTNLSIEMFHDIINSLPEPNKNALIYLMKHLMDIAKLQDQNKMGIANLVTVFAPNIFGAENKSVKEDAAPGSVFFVKGASIFKALLQAYWKTQGFETV